MVRRTPHSRELGEKPLSETNVYRVIAGYVESSLGRGNGSIHSPHALGHPCSWMPVSLY
jgi:hypothetical protein